MPSLCTYSRDLNSKLHVDTVSTLPGEPSISPALLSFYWEGLTLQPRLAWNARCNGGWPWIHASPSGSVGASTPVQPLSNSRYTKVLLSTELRTRCLQITMMRQVFAHPTGKRAGISEKQEIKLRYDKAEQKQILNRIKQVDSQNSHNGTRWQYLFLGKFNLDNSYT